MAKRRESLDIGDLIAQHKKAKLKAAPESQQGANRDDREDAARGSVVHLLARSLNSDPDQDENPHGAIAVAIEQELFSLHGGSSSRAYKTAVRNLVANLKRNDALVARVISEQLEPAELVRLQPAELATVSQQEQDAKRHDKLLRAATIHDSVETTGEYTCPECKSNACSISESVTNVCGKSDTWGAKQHEGKGRLVTCLTCGYKWEANLM